MSMHLAASTVPVQTTAMSGVAISTVGFASVLLALIVWYLIKHKNGKVGHMIVAGLLGVALGGTLFGSVANSVLSTGSSTIGTVTSNLTNNQQPQ
jgi:hypothetical protein